MRAGSSRSSTVVASSGFPTSSKPFAFGADDPGATADMNLAVALQGHIIRTIDASVVGGEDRVIAGHMEVPPAEFWGVCHEALLSTYAAVQTLIPYTSDSLTVELGAFRAPGSSGAFGDAI